MSAFLALAFCSTSAVGAAACKALDHVSVLVPLGKSSVERNQACSILDGFTQLYSRELKVPSLQGMAYVDVRTDVADAGV